MTKIRRNVDALRQVRDVIARGDDPRPDIPARFDMTSFGDMPRHREPPVCGTAMCIAGYACAALGGDRVRLNAHGKLTCGGRSVPVLARELLGLSRITADQLFFAYPSGGLREIPLKKVTREMAVQALDRLIEGKAPWTRKILSSAGDVP